MYIAVFFMIRPSDTEPGAHRPIPRSVILHVSGLLMWYSAALPMGRSFVMAILRCAGPEVNKAGVRARARSECFLSEQAKMDVEWWRATIILALKHPHVMRVPIDLIADNRAADFFLLQTDASTTVGGGGWMAHFGNQEKVLRSAVIRWSRKELRFFAEVRADINVLEFFTAAALIIAWGDVFAGKKVLVKIDNTSAKKWLISNRFSEGASWADSFMSLFSLFCALKKIYVISEHVSGAKNILADDLSRLLHFQEDWCRGVSRGSTRSSITSRGELSRRFFGDCTRRPSRIPLQELLAVLEPLLGMGGTASA
jgi:hypothetical protein